MLEKVWDEFILYSDNYIKFCDDIFHGFLDKPKFTSEKDEFDGYDYMYRLLMRKKRLLTPFWNLWPKYPKKAFYFEDKASPQVWLSSNQKKAAIAFFRE